MAENPLLPNAELRALLDLTRQCAKLEAIAGRKSAKQPSKRSVSYQPSSREALLAGSTLQLRPGDLLVCEPGDSIAAALAPTPEDGKGATPVIPGDHPANLPLSVAMAAALRGSGTDCLVMHYTRAGAPQPGWAEAFAWAQNRLLPWILVCSDDRGSQAFRPGKPEKDGALAWDAVHRTAAKLQLPVLTVDGEDAVAVYRVVQESVLRARAGGGPAVLWAMLPSAKDLLVDRPRAARPVSRLERYMKARRIAY